MKAQQAPHLDQRRTEEFSAELGDRARAWISTWALADGEGDFGRALLEIAARFSSEVAERLDRTGDKMRRGFLDWLGVRGEAARPARVPVVFKLLDAAPEAVLAPAPVQMQAEAAGTPVVFETESDVRVVPGRLEIVVAADADSDAFYAPPPGLSDLKPLESLPTQWRLKSFAAVGGTSLQLDPELGLSGGMILEAGGRQYRVEKVDRDLVTIQPPLETELAELTTVVKVTAFSLFDGQAHNWQEHALYLGHTDLLNIESAATIEVVGALGLREGIAWEYWGKRESADEAGWQPLTFDDARQQIVDDAVALAKPKGAVELTKIDEKNSRWIRAYARTIDPASLPFTTDKFSIRINASGCDEKLPCPPEDEAVSPVAEAMTNTTPLVLDNVFFPLGKEPRLFDAFYLGSEEAFSKKGASVQLCFEMADRTFSALVAVREGSFANTVLAGIAKDRCLHLLSFNPWTGAIGKFRDRDPLQPPQPGYLGIAEAGNAIALDSRPHWRLPVWSEPDPFPFASVEGFLVGVSAGDTIWIWHEQSILQANSGWINFGTLPTSDSATNAAVDGLVYLASTPPMLAALRGGELFMREWPNGPQWNRVDTVDGGNPIQLKSIVPVLVLDVSGRLVTSRAAGMLGVDDQKKLFHVQVDGDCRPLLQTYDFDARIRPVAVRTAGGWTVAAATESGTSSPPKLVAATGTDSNAPYDVFDVTTDTQPVTLDIETEVLAALEAVLSGGTCHVLTTVRDEAGRHLLTWTPFAAPPANSTFKSPAFGGGPMEGAPVYVGRFVVVPGARAEILFNEFDPLLRLSKSADLETGVVLPDSIPSLAVNDLIVRLDSGDPASRSITEPGIRKDGEVFYSIDSDFPTGATGLDAYHLSTRLAGSFVDPDLTLAPEDQQTVEGDWLWIDGEFYEVDSMTTYDDERVATLITPNNNGSIPPHGQYVIPIDTGGRVAPFMRLDATAGGSGDWKASLLNQTALIFPGQTPREQRGKAFRVTPDNKPEIVVLGEEFQSSPANPVNFLVDAAFGEWRQDAGDTSTNPELSWEYWNGKGWWKLDEPQDQTQNLKTTGTLRFTVPNDIASSDWAGKTNFWIRARLVGGDYGREKVTARTRDLGNNTTEQTIERSSEGIRAPSVVKLHISYGICDEVPPSIILTKDSGSFRDQSEANRTIGAVVEAFVPLAVTLGRLSQKAMPAGPAPNDCSPQRGDARPESGATTGSALASRIESPRVAGRALFLGLTRPPSGAPVNILLLVEEREHSAFAPMTIEALVGDQFVQIVAEDTTRALGESGLLSMSFPVLPATSELFGRSLTWLRLVPRAGTKVADWKPSLQGAYLNAVWASATETLTRELLGSSDGAPNKLMRLARPPVLRNTLELRVKEPLDEEERAQLYEADPASVVSEVNAIDGRRNDWVLWKQVVDPSDEAPDARVYALDESSGEIRFGDGQHGLIPPIGRDSIVAFRYQRTEPDPSGSNSVPGNLIAPRTVLNLVSPVATVESVIAADQAAGGAPREDDDRVLRFGNSRLRHRDRAVTLQDLQDLTVESSPDIAQALAITRQGYVRLIVVMRGRNPAPNTAQRRELRRYLIARALVSLGMTNALRIAGPRIRRLRLDLTLRVASLDRAGALGVWVKETLEHFFDTSTGGLDESGWLLGANPHEDDIALALLDAPDLESIKNVILHEIDANGRERPWPTSLGPSELAMLDQDPLRIHYETDEKPI